MAQIPSYPALSILSSTDKFVIAKGSSAANYHVEWETIKAEAVGATSITYAALLALQVGSTLGSGYRYFISLPTVTWNVASTYNLNDEVNDGAGNYYKSIQAANLANLVTDTTWWKQVYRGITLVANDVNVLDMHAEINISSVTNFILFDFTNDNVLAYSADVINNYYLLDSNTTTVGTPATTAKTTLASYTLPANTLDVDGDIIEIRSSGSFAATATTKKIEVNFGSEFLDNGITTINNFNWSFFGRIVRTGAATQDTDGLIFGVNQASTWSTPASTQTIGTLTEDLTTSILISVFGTNGTANLNDIVLEAFTVEHKKK